MVLHELGSEPFERWEYNAEYAQNDAESKSGGKGPDLKLGKEISRLVREEDYSPYAIIQKFKEKGWPSKTRICEKTIYSYIGAGVISGIHTLTAA